MKINAIISITALSIFALSGCNSKLDLDFTQDNHYLQKNPVPDQTHTIALHGHDDTHTAGEYAATQYSVVLVHGAYGFSDIFGMEYWYDIVDILEQNGATVYVARVSGANSPEVRGEQLIEQLELWNDGPYHLFGHSLGAPTSRYAASTRPELVASVMSVAGMNYGSGAADNSDAIDIPLVAPIIAFMGNALGHIIDIVDQESFEQNVLAVAAGATSEGAQIFNDAYPEGLDRDSDPQAPDTCTDFATNSYSSATNSTAPNYAETNDQDPTADFKVFYDGDDGSISLASNNVYYYSWGGTSVSTNQSDPLDGLHRATSKSIPGDEDDGFLERCSTHLGWVVKDNFNMNHLDFMNWFVGLRAQDSPYPPALYLAHLHHLKAKGL